MIDRKDEGLRMRKELVRELVSEADNKLPGGYSEFSSDFAGYYAKMGPMLASLDAAVTLRGVSCMEPEQARRFIAEKSPLNVMKGSVEVAYLELMLNVTSYMTPEQAAQFVEAHPRDLEIISDKDFAFRRGTLRLSFGSREELAYSGILVVAMRLKDLSLPVDREWIQNGLSLSGHSLDVGENMYAIAKHLGLSDEEVAEYRFHGVVHDTGKLAVEAEHLGSDKPLDECGWENMRQHTSRGETIIQGMAGYARTDHGRRLLTRASRLARWHHENYDGSGYPDGISKDEIPLGARALRIADFWDAATAHRSYRPAMSPETAIEEGKRCSGQPYDENLLRTHQERADPRFARWQKGPQMEFDPEICRGGRIFEMLADTTYRRTETAEK